MEAYLLLALFVCVVALAALVAVAITLAERVRRLEWINKRISKSLQLATQGTMEAPLIDPYVKRALDRANAS